MIRWVWHLEAEKVVQIYDNDMTTYISSSLVSLLAVILLVNDWHYLGLPSECVHTGYGHLKPLLVTTCQSIRQILRMCH